MAIVRMCGSLSQARKRCRRTRGTNGVHDGGFFNEADGFMDSMLLLLSTGKVKFYNVENHPVKGRVLPALYKTMTSTTL